MNTFTQLLFAVLCVGALVAIVTVATAITVASRARRQPPAPQEPSVPPVAMDPEARSAWQRFDPGATPDAWMGTGMDEPGR
jgi:hypothetical protein